MQSLRHWYVSGHLGSGAEAVTLFCSHLIYGTLWLQDPTRLRRNYKTNPNPPTFHLCTSAQEVSFRVAQNCLPQKLDTATAPPER